MAKLWVKAAHPNATFYQEVLDTTGEKAELVVEHVFAPTVNGKQVPSPVEVTDTPAVQRALLERLPGTDNPARIVRCEDDEIPKPEKKDPLAAARAAKAAKAAEKTAGTPSGTEEA